VQVGNSLSAACQIHRGVRQGCSLSPLLFIIYDEAMVKEATANEELGMKVGGQVISMIRSIKQFGFQLASERRQRCNSSERRRQSSTRVLQPQKTHARSQSVDRRVDGTTRVDVAADRRCRRVDMSQVSCNVLVAWYGGAVPYREQRIRTQTELDFLGTFSQ